MDAAWTAIEGAGAPEEAATNVFEGPDSVDVTGFERDADGCAFFALRIRIGRAQYEIKRRYSQFEALARAMRVAGRRHALPAKYMCWHSDENLRHRGKALEIWIRAVAADEACAADVRTYLWPYLELDAARALIAQARASEAPPGTPVAEMTAELAARRERSAERNERLSEAEAEQARLKAELGDKADEVKRLEHGMSTAKALVAALRQKLIAAESVGAPQQAATAGAERAAEGACAGAPQAAAGAVEPSASGEAAGEAEPAGEPPAAEPREPSAGAVEPLRPQPQANKADKPAKRKGGKHAKGDGGPAASARRPIASH